LLHLRVIPRQNVGVGNFQSIGWFSGADFDSIEPGLLRLLQIDSARSDSDRFRNGSIVLCVKQSRCPKRTGKSCGRLRQEASACLTGRVPIIEIHFLHPVDHNTFVCPGIAQA
jgi:hypothetical protein